LEGWRFAEICGDSPMLRLVSKDRMSNAVGYTSTQDRAMIEDMRSYVGKVIVLVRGAGVPFDPRYADKLIKMRQRLHKSARAR
jgi:light-regulated signal transduction histidine kinase (bacteriophytochrome)